MTGSEQMGIEERLRRLEAQRGPKLCEERYCTWGPSRGGHPLPGGHGGAAGLRAASAVSAVPRPRQRRVEADKGRRGSPSTLGGTRLDNFRMSLRGYSVRLPPPSAASRSPPLGRLYARPHTLR